jgi:hypothetical protein
MLKNSSHLQPKIGVAALIALISFSHAETKTARIAPGRLAFR